MTKNISVQAYLPPHLVAWLDNEATKASVSRSHWIGSVMLDLFQGQDLRDETRVATKRIQRQLTFLICSVDGLLAEHPDKTLRDRCYEAFRAKVEREREGGEQ